MLAEATNQVWLIAATACALAAIILGVISKAWAVVLVAVAALILALFVHLL